MIIFDILRWKNLLSTGNSWTEIQLSAQPMTLVVGKNGAGKSTMIDALCYGLFGKPYRKTNLGGLINSINQRDLVVEVEFRVGKRNYKIVRGQKPSVFEIYQDGTLLNQDASARDYQKVLEKTILGMNQKTFTQINVVGSNLYVPFMRLEAKDRRTVIEDILDIEVFSAMTKVMKQKHDALVEELGDVKKALLAVEGKMELHQLHLSEANRSASEQIVAKQEQLSAWDTEGARLAHCIKNLQAEIEELQAQIDGMDKLDAKIRKLGGLNGQITANLKSVSADHAFYFDHDTCPKCNQTIQDREVKLHECDTKIEEMQTALNQITEKMVSLQHDLTAMKNIQTQIYGKQNQISKHQAKITELAKYMKMMLKEIDELKNKKGSDDLVQVGRDLQAEHDRLSDRHKSLLEHKMYSDAAVSLLKDTGIKSKIIQQYLPAINSKVNKYLADMDFFVNFHLDENFNETIKSRHRDEFSYESFSEGQKRRIDLALLLTWRAIAKEKNSASTNLLILDEVLDGSLDSDGMDEFMRLLHTFGDGTNVFLISHRGDVLADKFTNVLTFNMVGTFSEMTS